MLYKSEDQRYSEEMPIEFIEVIHQPLFLGLGLPPVYKVSVVVKCYLIHIVGWVVGWVVLWWWWVVGGLGAITIGALLLPTGHINMMTRVRIRPLLCCLLLVELLVDLVGVGREEVRNLDWWVQMVDGFAVLGGSTGAGFVALWVVKLDPRKGVLSGWVRGVETDRAAHCPEALRGNTIR